MSMSSIFVNGAAVNIDNDGLTRISFREGDEDRGSFAMRAGDAVAVAKCVLDTVAKLGEQAKVDEASKLNGELIDSMLARKAKPVRKARKAK